MQCPKCNLEVGGSAGHDHRMCVFALLKENKIQSVTEWEAMLKPITIIKGKVIRRVKK
jgi:hypothetical protein